MDYMHLLCSGVVKKLILLWLGMFKKSPVSIRLQTRDVNTISNRLLSIKPYISCDFARKPRRLHEISRWKATELRLFILYTGPIVLKNILLNECYSHFLCLHVAFRVLLSSNSSEKLVNYSEKLLIHFVERFEEIYGSQFVSHNVHGLIHIVDDYRQFGPLDKCSCFPFENYMKVLKRMVRKHEKPLEQVINRHQEFVTFSKPKLLNTSDKIIYKNLHNSGPLPENLTTPQFKIVIKNGVKININSISDCYIGYENDKKLSIFKIINICHDAITGRKVFLSKQFKQIKQYFEKPISSLKLGIAQVDNLSESYITIDIEHINFTKYIIICNENQNVAYPILHSYEV